MLIAALGFSPLILVNLIFEDVEHIDSTPQTEHFHLILLENPSISISCIIVTVPFLQLPQTRFATTQCSKSSKFKILLPLREETLFPLAEESSGCLDYKIN
jgi:hypothetical protein